ncbi:MAG TPA: hypothetical protein VKS22_15090 [Candidatus Binataceae bacterium]|nr:hypothetical protein [Candidatus Binataceae bacterium]
MNASAGTAPQTSLSFRPLTWLKNNQRLAMLIAITSLGCLLVFLLVFNVQVLTFLSITKQMTHPWERWELAALVWTFSFGFVYFIDFPYVPNRSIANKLISLLSLVPVILTIPAAYCLLRQRFLPHFCLVLALATLLFVTDSLLYRLHEDRDIKLQYLETTVLADTPMLLALIVLGIYLWSFGQLKSENPDVFLAGAIAFQLVASNAIFVLIQSRVIHKVRERLASNPA